jgi:Transposase
MGKVWSGVDTGKAHHHCVVIDGEGRRLLSRRVANDEPELERLITEVTALGEEVTWAADMAGGARRC